jgi:hypothetical protein
VSPDLVELAGGTAPVLERARRYLAQGRALEAMHLAEAALAADARCLDATRVKLEATEHLLERCSRENFSETRWLEAEVRSLKGAIAAASA